MTRQQDVIDEVARIAAEVGPVLTPAGHHELLRVITLTVKELFNAAACSLALLDEEREELEFYVASGSGAEDITGLRIPIGRGIAGWVVTSGQPIEVGDVKRDARFAADVAATSGYSPTSILAMPMQTERQMIGVIEVLDRDKEIAGERDTRLLAMLADQAALAIENSRIFEDMGRVLLTAAAESARGGEVTHFLERAAEDAPSPSTELAGIASHMEQLGRLGPAERRAAAELLRTFLSYASKRQP